MPFELVKITQYSYKKAQDPSPLPRKQNLTNGNHHVVGFLLSADFPLEELWESRQDKSMCVKRGLVSCYNLDITQMFGRIGLVHIVTKLPVVLQANQYIHFTELGLQPVWTKMNFITDQSNQRHLFFCSGQRHDVVNGILVWTFNLSVNFNMSSDFISIK